MTDSLDAALSQAFELIEANRHDEARVLLEPLLDEYPDDTELWWVYAHAVEDPDEAKTALQKIIELDDRFEGAQTLLAEIDGEPAPSVGELQSLSGIKTNCATTAG